MSYFYLGAAALVVIALFLALIPWLRASKSQQQDVLSNTILTKQRMEELENELAQGLLSDKAKLQAEKEIKLALVDEMQSPHLNQSKAGMVLVFGLVIAVAATAGVYYQANQVQQVVHWQKSIERLPELSKRIVMDGDSSIVVDDLRDFALGLRTKLREQSQDPTGWMLLGRVFSSVNQFDSAISAYKKSLQLDPNNIGTLGSFSQALMMTGLEQDMRQAKAVLQRVLSLEADNTNAMGMLALVAAQLGDKQLALANWKNLLGYMPPSDPAYLAVQERIDELSSELGEAAPEPATEVANTVISVEVSLADSLLARLPQQAYLFVFAQDASGQNRMPAAVVKTKLTSLPIKIELSDLNAMMPTYKLSQLKNAKLVARISLDEFVPASPGDLQGEITIAVQAGSKMAQQIMINEEIL